MKTITNNIQSDQIESTKDVNSPFGELKEEIGNIVCYNFDSKQSELIAIIHWIVFAMLNYLSSDLACRFLFPKALISNDYIDCEWFSILRGHNELLAPCDGTFFSQSIIPHAGTVVLKNNACQMHFPGIHLRYNRTPY